MSHSKRNILYLNNFMSVEIARKRNAENIFSQPANNKVTGILDSLKEMGCNITILSSGLLNSKSGRWYPRSTENYHEADVIYCGILALPLINTISSIVSMYQEIKKQAKKRKIDNLIFYNYKPEVAWPAYLAKRKLKIPITIEYEDGYRYVDGISGFKAWIFKKTEEIVSKNVDSAILVNSRLRTEYSVPSTIVRGVVNKEFYEECQKFKRGKNEKLTILYSGGLDKSRGIDVLLKALQYLKMDCKVIITGKGQLDGLDPRVDFKGFLSYEEMKNCMKQADILIQAQLVKDDFSKVSFPSKLFEYIATGNVIISSAMPEIKKFAGDALTYYENDDSRKLAECIEKIYEDVDVTSMREQCATLCVENLPIHVGEGIISIL